MTKFRKEELSTNTANIFILSSSPHENKIKQRVAKMSFNTNNQNFRPNDMKHLPKIRRRNTHTHTPE